MSTAPFPEESPLSAEQEARLDALCDRFEDAWKAGERPRVEDYLADAPESERAGAAWELLRVDAHYRRLMGEQPRPADYQTRLPALGLTAITRALTFAPSPDEVATRWEPRDGPGPPSDATPTHLPAVPGYEIVGVLGRGGMAVVYQALDPRLGRPVALKFLRPEIARDAEALERFRREARTASSLNHPHIGTVYALHEHEGQPYLVMEFVEGRTLRALADRPMPLPTLIPLIRQAIRALGVAHAVGIVHRDVKPENIMVRPDGLIKVLDFGLARLLPAATAQVSAPSGRLTDPGALVGTLRYMAPEQARTEPVGAAADVFSLGLVFYELATGQHPFHAESEIAVLNAIIAQAPLPPSRLNPEISPPLESLILHMLAKDSRLRPTAVEVEATLTRLTPGTPAPPRSRRAEPGRRPVVGRRQEGAALRAGFEEAAAGRGSLLCVTGEPGLGKTTLVESFLEELAAGDQAWGLARGRCSERLAGAEVYLPFLEALDGLLQGEGGASAAQAMKVLAPTWYVQLAPLAAADPSLARVLAEAKDASQERRKRELALFLQEVTRQRPVVVFLDDVHWADPSSVDLLAYLGSKCSGLRLLLVLTYRTSDLLRSEHPFGPVKLELQGRGVCREIALPYLSRDDFDRYLALAFAGHQFPEELPALLHARTEGNPLFMVDLLRYLRDRGVIVQDHGRWALVRAMPDLRRELPESVRGMIQRKVDQLSAADRHLLMAASVQGPEFDSAVVARVLGREAADVEERLEVQERVHVLVRRLREQAFPDGTLTIRYGFVHVLYQNTLYAALQPTRKAAWSAAAAKAILSHYGEKSTVPAVELAMLFEAARDHQRAADQYGAAAENAARVFAHQEAAALARRGLALLDGLPDTPERARRELPLQVALAMQLQVVEGYAAPEVERIYARARALCEREQEAAPLFPLLWGLWMFYEVRCELGKSWELARRLFTLAQKSQEPAQLLQARQAMAITSLCLGNPAAAREHMEQGVVLYDSKRDSIHTYMYGLDSGVGCLAFGAVALWLLGYPDRAAQRSHEALALSHELLQPSSQALALHFAAVLHQMRREPRAVLPCADLCLAISAEYSLTFWHANGTMMRGWALSECDSGPEGVAQARQGLDAWLATGSLTYQTYYLGLLPVALAREGRAKDGLKVLDDALALAERTDEHFFHAELHRLQGELLMREAGPGVQDNAEACFREAIALARRQAAKSLELRAAMSLTRLRQEQGRQAEARPMLAECYAWFTEGFDTPDLQEAKALLEQIS